MPKKSIDLKLIEVDAGTQARASTDDVTIIDYADAIKGGKELPPPVVFSNGALYYMGDGFHRYFARLSLGEKTIICDVRDGGKEDALRHACGSNAEHGKRRTNEDKRHSIKLACDQWPDLSNSAIAAVCNVSDMMVADHREDPPGERKGKDGKTYQVQDLEPEQPSELHGDEARLAMTDFHSPYVKIWEFPSKNEVKDSVDYTSIGTWEELVRGLEIPVTQAHHEGETTPLILRKLATTAINARERAEGRPPIFRGKPLSAEHHDRAEAKEAKADREEAAFKALDELATLDLKGVDPFSMLRFLADLAYRSAGAGAKDILGRYWASRGLDAYSGPDALSTPEDCVWLICASMAGQGLRNCELADAGIYQRARQFFKD